MRKYVMVGAMKLFLVFAAVLVGSVSAIGAHARIVSDSAPALRISVTQTDEGEVALVYDLRRPRREVVFKALPEGYRASHWTVETPGFLLTRDRDRARLQREDGARFSHFVIAARASRERLPKDYKPVSAYGASGALIYTGHFLPRDESGAPINAAFDFTAGSGARVFALDAYGDTVADWRSPTDHPTYVYLGPIAPVLNGGASMLIAPETPEWIVAEFTDLVPQVFSTLEEMFGFGLDTKPSLFLSVGNSSDLDVDQGRLSYSGDALPGQFQILLEGGAWSQPSDKGREIFTHSTIHEAVHLWQTAARPFDETAPDWIHEGAADAITAEVLVMLGIWDEAAFAADKASARAECADELHAGSLNGASARGDFRALYACGHVIADAVAIAEGKGAGVASTAAYWRQFIDRAQAEDGYTEAMFHALVQERTGDRDFARALRQFTRTPLADPAREIASLMVQADSVR